MALSCRRLAGFSQNSGIHWAVSESCNFEKPRYVQRLFFNFLWLVAFQNPTLAQ